MKNDFLENPSTQYANPVVDLVLPAIMHGLKARGIVYKTDDRGVISELHVGPEIIRDCFFGQTSFRHLDAVSAKFQPMAVEYSCNSCNKTFGGTKRLAHHEYIVKSESKLFPKIFTNDSSSPIVLDDEEEEELGIMCINMMGANSR